MANLSEPRASEACVPDWIAQAGRAAQQSAAARSATPGWMAALGPVAIGDPGGFRDEWPFRAPDEAREPDPGEAATLEEDAYGRGYADGHEEARRAGEAALEAERARYRELRLAFRALDGAALDALAQELSATVLALCEETLGEYACDADALAQRCCVAAQRLGAGAETVVLHLHPETLDRVDAQAFAGWTIEPDSGLAPGALRLTSADGAVRDGPDDWRRAIADALGV